MDAWQAKQPETRLVRWPWVGAEQLVTMPHWHWHYFDYLCRRYKLQPGQLHRRISAAYPIEKISDMRVAIQAALEVQASREQRQRRRLANDDAPWQSSRKKSDRQLTPEDRHAARCQRPVRYSFPVIQSSPFQPMARPKRLFAEAEIRDR